RPPPPAAAAPAGALPPPARVPSEGDGGGRGSARGAARGRVRAAGAREAPCAGGAPGAPRGRRPLAARGRGRPRRGRGEPAPAWGKAYGSACAEQHRQRSPSPPAGTCGSADGATRSTGFARQPEPAGQPQARPRRARHAVNFRSASSRGSASSCGTDAPTMAALVAERSLEVHQKLQALLAEGSAEQPPQAAGQPQERASRRLHSGRSQSGPASDLDSSAIAESPVEPGRCQPHIWRCTEHNSGEDQARSVALGALPMVAPQRSVQPRSRRPSVRSMWSAARSMFVGDNLSLAPVESQPGATSAMDMIEHDTVRSYDLKPFWRQATPRHDVCSAERGTSFMGSRMPWPVRKWLSRFDVGPSLTRFRVKQLVTSARYEVCVMMLIMANSIFIGYQVEHEAHTRKEMQRSLEIEAFFCVVFTLELVVKVYALSWTFWSGSEVSWNLFDIFVVVLMILDFFVSVSQPTAESSLWSQGQVLRVLRVLRVVRFMRSVRQLRFFMQLRIMIQSIMFSLRPLLWATIVLVGMFYMFGIILTQGVIDSLKEHDSWDDESSAELRSCFGTLEGTALSLFQAMSGGINWGELFAVLSPLALPFKCVFLFYVLFAIFGAANVLALLMGLTVFRGDRQPLGAQR
ncbi:unnamed protein product, partial [Prorocentrum cordatum]